VFEEDNMSAHTRPVADRGQVTPLMAVVVVVAGGIALVIMAVGGVLADRAAARTAADAAALAAAAETGTDIDTVAESVAAANGATLMSVHRHGNQVEVEVRVGRATSRARAEASRGPRVDDPARPTRGSIP
jgi:Flp pilus assembly protein TadG